jgi:hypothetical protein
LSLDAVCVYLEFLDELGEMLDVSTTEDEQQRKKSERRQKKFKHVRDFVCK